MAHTDGFYVFGGFMDDIRGNVIAKVDYGTKAWSQVGLLNAGRIGHGAVFDGRVFLVVGGTSAKSTEACEFSEENNALSCQDQDPILTGYYGYPELIEISEDFSCK